MSKARPNDDTSLLLTLEEVSQLVAHSSDPAETLANIVHLIQGRFHTAVCSVYFLEPETDELVLGATVGLRHEGVGRVRMRVGEGLTGLVAAQRKPLAAADAPRHPGFKYFPEAGEDPYHSFLGVPLVEGGALQGVLVVQTVEPRAFSPSEVRMLVTVGAQVASLVGDARLLQQVAAAAHGAPEPAPALPDECYPMATLQGVPLSAGSGLGQAYVVDGLDQWRQAVPQRADDPAAERERLRAAMDRAREEIARLSQRISELVGEEHGAILQAQLMIMRDRTVEQDLDASLRGGASAEGALLATLDKYVAAFRKVATPFFQERVYDVQDVFLRVLWQLRPLREAGPGGDQVVLVAREASVLELFAVDLDRLAAVVVEHGGPQSHAAILARSLGIPMVGQVAQFPLLLRPGRRLLVDGTSGVVGVDPPPDCTVDVPRPPSGRLAARGPELAPGLPRVEANLNLLYEAGAAAALGVTGVGLYRSEFLFLARRTLPTEEEQVGIYRKLVQKLAGRPVSIRTFDLRPDKLASYSHLTPAAARPFDWRRVLESPPLQQLFRDQVRAVLRAADGGPVRLLIPLVTRTELLDFVLETLGRAKEELAREGLAHEPDVPLGAMIETAAAVPLVGEWAAQVAYFAVGTNDLTASALGLDRDDTVAAGLADPLHPGVLRLVRDIVAGGHAAGRQVTVCGEVAADPLGALALAALEVDALSVPVNRYAATRHALAGHLPDELCDLRAQILRQRTGTQIRTLLQEWGKADRDGTAAVTRAP
jgi:phosphotransferase system enzyme I (PtsP)